MKLQVKEWWDDISEPTAEYEHAQIKRHGIKLKKRRPREQYAQVYNFAKEYVSSADNWLCLGTRNNWEKKVFSELTSQECSVYSLDIAKKSNADYIMDFNNPIPNSFLGKWDVIYTNVLDHAIDAGEVLLNWMLALKENGVFLWHWYQHTSISASDCCSFSYEHSIKYFEKHNITIAAEIQEKGGGVFVLKECN